MLKSTYAIPLLPPNTPISSNLNQGFLGSQSVLQQKKRSGNKYGLITRRPVAATGGENLQGPEHQALPPNSSLLPAEARKRQVSKKPEGHGMGQAS